jgi:ABC-type uncharacterized transport system permease subunit
MADEKAKIKQGRPTRYKPDYAAMIAELAANPESILVRGQVSVTKIAKLIGVSPETVRLWRTLVAGRENQYQPEFAAAIAACQNAVDTDAIKRSMIARARGFVQKKTKLIYDKDGKVCGKQQEKITMAGDVEAAKLVLNNIDKSTDKWNTAAKQEHDVSNSLADLLKTICS